MKIPTATVSGNNVCLLQRMCRERIADIAEDMRSLHVSNYPSEFEYGYAVIARMCEIRDVVDIYLEVNNTMENK
jgi:hypothetical protein